MPSFLDIDFPCLLASVLFFTSDLLVLVGHSRMNAANNGADFKTWKELDPEYIEEEWRRRAEARGYNSSALFLGAFAWFSLSIPILNIAWILSSGGKRRIGLHVAIAALAIGSSISELIARLMILGMENIGLWLARDWNLDNWVSSDTSNDGMGWRVLEVAYMMSHGIILWVDAFEWLALFGIFVLIYISMVADGCSSAGEMNFSMRWAKLGLVVGALSLLAFVADVLRFVSWRTWSIVRMFVMVVNTLILFPIWLIWLGRQLPMIRSNYENAQSKERVPLNSSNTAHEASSIVVADVGREVT
mmetsp:Transcript_20962/g.31964  ORF Transcript_20962/g.31964 Transcript_20962/m.31964 type:complete len:303 (-) Transcript_20962:122-1030(-)|eukprot:CAMPEP_0196815298 /NCGR_PEP_ID=MMETSP1362-20130617/48921_1 /TAXON_ID=163516 /ORGANISM="Leptocylindrus danicus, Strain CCMP1856" /LENGTH=302 /DNA_ID=CAMNT_0042192205 /DNA_START=50 /DNA_END=958 /DNA_ORIENTATION=+